MSAGIDYGLGMANIDRATGIRYGVISTHDVLQAWCDSSECVYPDVEHSEDCEDSETCYCGEYAESIGAEFQGEGYEAHCGNDGFGIFITKSPYYTYAPFCSPCAPGAGDLDNALPANKNLACSQMDYPKVYCFDHSWFEDGKAPYRVFRVSDDSEVLPED